jgi:cobalt/nickel transport system ATP-binding protein
MNDIILEARDISYRYPCGKNALTGLSVAIPRGKKVAVLGANGSGKTTLFLCLNGTIRPQSGRVLLDGNKADYARRELSAWRRRVGLVFQDPEDQVVAGTVIQDVAFGPLNLGFSHHDARQRAQETMEALGIERFADRPTHELSHGERKLVAIAGVLAMQPEVIILDEPMAGLDPAGTAHVSAVLEGIHRRGTTLVVSTHDMDLAYEWADEAVVLQNGRTSRQRPIHDIFKDDAAIQEARLRPPLLLEITQRLREKGLLADDGRPIRSRQQLFEELSKQKNHAVFGRNV